MNDINYNEKIKIPKLLDKKKQLRKEYNTNKNLTLDEKMQIKDDINDIKKQIRELNKKRDDYLLNNSKFVHSYFEEKQTYFRRE